MGNVCSDLYVDREVARLRDQNEQMARLIRRLKLRVDALEADLAAARNSGCC